MKTHADIVIFTDGASSGNPGKGGWGAIILDTASQKVTELGGAEAKTTNNRMELVAAIEALALVAEIPGQVIVYTDSKYVRDGIEKWVPVWEKRGWKTTAKKEVLNQDLWQKLAAESEKRAEKIMWRLVGGHRDVPANERADKIAVAFTTNKKPELFSGPATDYQLDLSTFTDLAMESDHEILGLDRAKKGGSSHSSKNSGKKAYSYISMVDGKIATHKTWEECFARVGGVSGARFKKALSADDEKQIIAQFKSL